MRKVIEENHEKYLERVELYKSFGYDIESERRFLLDKIVPICGDILEIGTGKGYLTIALAKEGYNFISIDISAEEQEYARLRLKYLGLEGKVNFKVENAENLSFADKSFGTIILSHVVHHFNSPFVVIDELTRIISYGGKIILSDFNKEGLNVVDKVHQSEGRSHQVSPIGLSDIERYFKKKNFSTDSFHNKFQDVLLACLPNK